MKRHLPTPRPHRQQPLSPRTPHPLPHRLYALGDRDLIRLQDRDFFNLPAPLAKTVRRLQRAYVEVWVEVLTQLDPTTPVGVARTEAHAVFGLLNSTPHSAHDRNAEITRRVLEKMALAALREPVNGPTLSSYGRLPVSVRRTAHLAPPDRAACRGQPE